VIPSAAEREERTINAEFSNVPPAARKPQRQSGGAERQKTEDILLRKEEVQGPNAVGHKTASNFHDLTGMRFGILTVVSRAENKTRRKSTSSGKYVRGIIVCWNCVCDCGKAKVMRSCSLISGKSVSCGCVGAAHRLEATTKHNGCKTRLYRIWAAMLTRTRNPKAKFYYCYGGRGISVCDEWKNDFASFMNWSLSHGYQDNLSIDRINNDGNYEPSNCRWATAKEQQSNKRKWGEGKKLVKEDPQ